MKLTLFFIFVVVLELIALELVEKAYNDERESSPSGCSRERCIA